MQGLQGYRISAVFRSASSRFLMSLPKKLCLPLASFIILQGVPRALYGNK